MKHQTSCFDQTGKKQRVAFETIRFCSNKTNNLLKQQFFSFVLLKHNQQNSLFQSKHDSNKRNRIQAKQLPSVSILSLTVLSTYTISFTFSYNVAAADICIFFIITFVSYLVQLDNKGKLSC
jgi:hypothetical protein